jgi:hypothetical protein
VIFFHHRSAQQATLSEAEESPLVCTQSHLKSDTVDFRNIQNAPLRIEIAATTVIHKTVQKPFLMFPGGPSQEAES